MKNPDARARGAAAVWVPLAELAPWDKNPRKNDHRVPEAMESLRRFGFCAPIVCWASERMIVAGHARRKAMRAILEADPTLEREENRRLRESLTGPSPSHVPVRFREFASAQEAEAYALRDNNPIGEWDEDALRDVLAELYADEVDLTGLGWSAGEIEGLLASGEPLNGIDEEPGPLVAVPRSRVGEVYELGPHLLACGDSTDAEVWRELMGDSVARGMWTDPPYGVGYVGKTGDALEIENDKLGPEALEKLLLESIGAGLAHCADGAATYVASPAANLQLVFMRALDRLELLRHTLVWVKDQFVLGHSDYHYRHEPIFYGWKPGKRYFTPERTHTSVLEFARPRRNDIHPTMKPVELVRHCVRNSTRPGDLVIDPFSGSGTTIIAAAAEGRVARAIELDPRYVDATRIRWTAFARSAGVDPGSGALE